MRAKKIHSYNEIAVVGPNLLYCDSSISRQYGHVSVLPVQQISIHKGS